jgi:ribosomal protein S8
MSSTNTVTYNISLSNIENQVAALLYALGYLKDNQTIKSMKFKGMTLGLKAKTGDPTTVVPVEVIYEEDIDKEVKKSDLNGKGST